MRCKCEACNGKGYTEAIGLKFDCEVCHGVGEIEIPDNMMICPSCKGKKKVVVMTPLGFATEDRCKTCLGKGLVNKS